MALQLVSCEAMRFLVPRNDTWEGGPAAGYLGFPAAVASCAARPLELTAGGAADDHMRTLPT
jgi:hypothetical protein